MVVKHTQTIRRQIANELFEWVWPLCGVGANFDSFLTLRFSRKKYDPLEVYITWLIRNAFLLKVSVQSRIPLSLRKNP